MCRNKFLKKDNNEINFTIQLLKWSKLCLLFSTIIPADNSQCFTSWKNKVAQLIYLINCYQTFQASEEPHCSRKKDCVRVCSMFFSGMLLMYPISAGKARINCDFVNLRELGTVNFHIYPT